MTINGEEKTLAGNLPLSELLQQEGFKIERVAVELNGEIVPKAAYGSVFLSEADQLEVVSFVGGG
ncbi:MAG: sulfur carrier protein ThiS [Lachnospiraceae bacterium]|nr:sulfur carrier protein ThiS [Lachnospiraceae bacterium]